MKKYTIKTKIICQSGKIYFSTHEPEHVRQLMSSMFLKPFQAPLKLITAEHGNNSIFNFKLVPVYPHDVGGMSTTRTETLLLEVDSNEILY